MTTNAHDRMNQILDQLATEDDERQLARLTDEAMELAASDDDAWTAARDYGLPV